MQLLPLLAHILIFILRCGGKLDLTPGDLQGSSTSKGQNTHSQSQKVMKIVYYYIYKLCLCSRSVPGAQGDYC